VFVCQFKGSLHFEPPNGTSTNLRTIRFGKQRGKPNRLKRKNMGNMEFFKDEGSKIRRE
jgi:hypothetical protein